MEESNTPKEQNRNQNKKYIIISAIVVVVIGIGMYFFFNKEKKEAKIENNMDKDSLIHKVDSLKRDLQKDSIQVANTQNRYYDEEEPYGNYIYVGNDVNLGSVKLKSGQLVYVDYSKSNDSEKRVFLDNPYQNKNLPYFMINANTLIDEYTYDRYTKNFALAPFKSLPMPVKDLILDNNYNNGNSYNVTQSADRAKSTICFGDFDGDGSKDVAVLLDNNEKQIGRLLIICTNSGNDKPYIAFAENYNDKMRINSFKKGAPIILNSDLEPSENDGIILNGEDVKLAVVYNKDLQKFKTYYQE